MRWRVLRACARHGVPDDDAVEAMLTWDEGGGFFLDAHVRIEATDCGGLERLVRYCARSPMALERLSWKDEESLTYRLTKPSADGRRQLSPVSRWRRSGYGTAPLSTVSARRGG